MRILSMAQPCSCGRPNVGRIASELGQTVGRALLIPPFAVSIDAIQACPCPKKRGIEVNLPQGPRRFTGLVCEFSQGKQREKSLAEPPQTVTVIVGRPVTPPTFWTGCA